MEIIRSALKNRADSTTRNAEVWACGLCGKVHLSFDDVLINLDPVTFQAFLLQAAEALAELAGSCLWLANEQGGNHQWEVSTRQEFQC